MGLTLNTNSLNLVSSGDSSSAASGISTSDVTTLIKSNTPWQYITKLTADASSYLEYTSIPSTFYTIRIMYDGLQFSQNTAVRLRLYLDGSLAASYLYRFAGRVSNGSTTSNLYTTNTYWGIAHSHEAGGRHFMGFTDIGGNTTASQKQMFSRVGSVNSTVPLNYDLSGHYDSGSTQLITGFRLYPASGTFSKGSIKIYGMN